MSTFNPLTSKFGKGKQSPPAPTGNQATAVAPTFVTVEMLDAHFNQFGNQLAAVMSSLQAKIDAIATQTGQVQPVTTVVAPVPDNAPISEVAKANANDPSTWTAERLAVTPIRENKKGHQDGKSIVEIMEAIRDSLPGGQGMDEFKLLRQGKGEGGKTKDEKIAIILKYAPTYGKVAPGNAPVEPTSDNPAVLLAWKKVAELESKGYTQPQIISMLIALSLPNVLAASGKQPDPSKAIVLPAVKPETPAFLVAIRNPEVQAAKYANTKKHAATIKALYEQAEKDIAKHKGNKEYAKIRWATYMEATKTINGDSTDGCRTNPKSFSHYAALHNLENAVWGGKPSVERHANAVAKQAELDKKAAANK